MHSPDRGFKRVQGVLLAALLCLATAMPCLAQGAAGKPQLIWFAPRDHAIDNINGSIDYIALFTASSPWTQAASHVQIFKFYRESILLRPPNGLTDDQLRQALADLQRRHILLAVETGTLTSPPDGHCGNTEGFFGENSLALAARIKRLGGNLDYIAMDEPFQHAIETQCNWTPQQVAENAAQNIASIKSIFPNVKVGDIEIVPSPDMLTQYAAWFDAWRVAAGEPLAFFHADDSSHPIPAIDAVRQIVEERQIPFGIIYDGLYSDQSDGDWVNHAQSHYESIETVGKVIPDHVIFQSWYPYPKHMLPESDPTTFTHLIDTYFRTRTGLSASVAAGEISGRLVDDQLNPVAGAPITVTAEAESGPGIIATYTLTGTVPAASTEAVIHVNVNTENNGAVGTNDTSVYSFAYSDSGNQTMLDFANGLQGWYLNATGSVRAISDANGAGIQISATPNQFVQVSSAFFAVTPGSNYVLTVRARISPSSVGSGNFPLIFLAGGIETTRATLPFTPAKVVVGTTQTKSGGTYSVPNAPPNADQFRVQAAFPGDDLLWPAIAVVAPPTSPAIEYYYAAWDYYFETAFPDEIAALDGGAFGGVWKRTGETFKVWPQSNAAATPTCRFFSGTFFAPKSSHFYTPFASECAGLMTSMVWQFEGISFYIALADANGLCAAGTVPLYRLYNNGMGGAPNHRYTTSLATLNLMLATGWVFEGNGITTVFACVPQ